MNKFSQSKKDINIIILVSSLSALFIIGLNVINFYQLHSMHVVTEEIYEHPLKVSNTALKLNAKVYKMHRDMKSIVLLLSHDDLDNLIENINHNEQRVYKFFKIIEQNILEDEGQKLEAEAKQLFKDWKPIRDEVISLTKNHKFEEAEMIVREEGARHVEAMESSILKLYIHAQSKADEFKAKSNQMFEKYETINLILTLLFLLVFTIFSFFVIRKITRHIKKNEYLNNVLLVIRAVNQLIVRQKEPQKLIQECCDILISTHIYKDAWIVIYDEDMDIKHIASTYDAEDFMQLQEKLKQGWVPYCISKTREKSKGHSFIEDTQKSCPECSLSGKYNNESALNIVLKHNEKLYGYLTISIDKKPIRDKEELMLLEEVAGDIAYALYNITIQKQLIEQEERYRYIVEGTTDGLWDRDLSNNEVYISPRWKEILGYRDDELENSFQTWKSLLHPDDFAQAHLDVKTAINSKDGRYRNTYRLKHKDGHWVWVDSRAKTIFDKENKPIRMIGSHTDVSREKEAQNEIVRLKELYDNVVDSVDNLIFVKDVNSVYITCNKAFEKTLGKSKEQIIGKIDYELFSKDTADAFRKHDQIIFSHNKIISSHEWVIYPDGQKVYFLTVKSPLINTEGKTIGLVGNSVDITEQKMMQEALELEKRRYEAVEKIGKVGGWEYIIKTQKFLASSESKRIYGFSGESGSFTTELVESCIPERERVHQALIDLLENGLEYNLEFEIHPFDGSAPKIISSIAEVKYDENGQAEKVVGFIQDISARKHVEEKLRFSREKFEKAFHNTPNVLLITKMQTGEIIEVNQTGEKVLGYKKEELIGKKTIDVNLWDDIADRQKYVDALNKDGFVENFIHSLNKKNGEKIILNIYASVASIDGERYILTVANDITEQEKALKQLKDKKEELETIFNEAPAPMSIGREDGKILMINKVWQDLAGYSHSEIDTIGKMVKKMTPEYSKQAQEDIENLFDTQQRVDEGDFEITAKNGKKMIWTFTSAPLGIIDGKKVRITTAMDVTELKRKDELMILQSRHAAMGEMIGMIAHQWRQPITGIAMDANNILLDIATEQLDDTKSEKYARDILNQTGHLSKTIDDFRNFFKPDKSISKVKLEDVLRETYTIVKDSLVNNNIEFKTSYLSESEVDAYPRELMQVFVNIINNAKDALLAGHTQNPLIEVSIEDNGAYVDVTVCDNGTGIDEAILAKIFDPYFTTKEDITGTGLGLYMSKMIVEDHLHGKIEAYNQDIGACFRVKLLKQNSSLGKENNEERR
ncbi:PAS domain S-box protein [Sulfurimonas sp.]|uniref:PAS domain S-box protein n=1 Tax=Sulfurimonas sp. TaxID=2022749 RepID=UPI0026047C8A|nr:PAS domain S-box protein [Sulfurimonas sp.]MCW8895558.1 PAS domain S-box protein [Sulfurimonas sp.]